MFNHILVPTDFGEPAEQALEVAIALAGKCGAKLTLLHTVWMLPSAYAAYVESFYWPTEDVMKGVRKEMAEVLANVKKRHPNVEGVVVTGEPPQAILDNAKERGCDLVVMGTHGRRGILRALLGSVAEKVVRTSPVPVLTTSSKGPWK